MLSRLERRNVIFDSATEPGSFGGRYYEDESGQEVVYRARRLPLAFGVSLVAGSISGLLGLGGAILQVPALNAWCGIPLRAAAATSAVMIGITAAASAPLYYARGDIVPPLAAAAVLGTFLGSRAGLWFGARARVKWLKLLMAAILSVGVGDVSLQGAMTVGGDESSFERVTGAVMLVAFWMAFATLAVGTGLWLAVPASDSGSTSG